MIGNERQILDSVLNQWQEAINAGNPDRVASNEGTMHNFSYLGGFIGIITGTIYLIVERVLRIGHELGKNGRT